MKTQKFISTNEAAKLLGVGTHAIRRLHRRGTIKGEVVGGKIVIAYDESFKKRVAEKKAFRKKLGLESPEGQISLKDIFSLLKSIDKRLQALEDKRN